MEKKKIQERFWRSHNTILENFEQVKDGKKNPLDFGEAIIIKIFENF